MNLLVEKTQRAKLSLGQCQYGPTVQEQGSQKVRRSLYVAQNMKSGEVFTQENLRAIRPGLGLPLKYYDEILSRRITKDTPKGTPLTWELVE